MKRSPLVLARVEMRSWRTSSERRMSVGKGPRQIRIRFRGNRSVACSGSKLVCGVICVLPRMLRPTHVSCKAEGGEHAIWMGVDDQEPSLGHNSSEFLLPSRNGMSTATAMLAFTVSHSN